VSPTRELAEQIAVEAAKICRGTDLIVQVAVGGNSKREMLRKVQREGCHILVATPGRLNDLLTDPYSKVEAPGLTTLVLDEADRLLSDGFAQDIEDITQLLPSRHEVDRQTMLFSATMPREVMALVRKTLKPDFHFVQTVQEGDIQTHDKVPQKLVSVPGLENLMPTLLELAKREIGKAKNAPDGAEVKPFKAIVYFDNTAGVILANEIFQNLKDGNAGQFGRHPLYPADILVMHGQLTQERRTRNSDRFRRAKSAILFSTDVTARGMDFPGVTHVIQIGLPSNREQYVHRVGRTGRGDKTGEGLIMLHENDVPHSRRLLGGLPITPDESLEAAKVDMTAEAQLPAALALTLTQIGDATRMVERELKAKAYLATLSTAQRGAGPHAAIEALNRWSRFGWGWDTPPSIAPGLAQKLGLHRVQGVNLGKDRPAFDRDGDSRRGFGDRGNRGGDRSFGGSRGGGFGGRSAPRDGGYGERKSGFGGSRDRGFEDRPSLPGFGSRGGRGGDRY
jgi:ATP-dependent RNA helicase MSS116